MRFADGSDFVVSNTANIMRTDLFQGQAVTVTYTTRLRNAQPRKLAGILMGFSQQFASKANVSVWLNKTIVCDEWGATTRRVRVTVDKVTPREPFKKEISNAKTCAAKNIKFKGW